MIHRAELTLESSELTNAEHKNLNMFSMMKSTLRGVFQRRAVETANVQN